MHQTKNLYQNVQTHFSTFHLVTIFYELNACYFCHFKREREKKKSYRIKSKAKQK